MERLSKFNAARIYEKRALLIAVNAVASLSIFFFGYDQVIPARITPYCNTPDTNFMTRVSWEESMAIVTMPISWALGVGTEPKS